MGSSILTFLLTSAVPTKGRKIKWLPPNGRGPSRQSRTQVVRPSDGTD